MRKEGSSPAVLTNTLAGLSMLLIASTSSLVVPIRILDIKRKESLRSGRC